MADEAEEGGGGDEGGREDGGSVLKKYGPFAAIILLVQVVLAWVVIQYGFLDGGAEDEEQDPFPEPRSVEVGSEEGGESDELPYYYSPEELTSITANPAGTNSERFVVVTVQLGLKARDLEDNIDISAADMGKKIDEEPLKTKMATYVKRIVSIVTKTLRVKTVEDLSGEYIHEIEEEVRLKLNQHLFSRLYSGDEDPSHQVRVVEVDFTNLIIQ